MQHPFVVGVTGGSGSGKTHFLSQLLERFSDDQVTTVYQDNYYRSWDQQKRDDNGVINFDIPHSIDDDEFFKDLQALKSGKTVERLEYLFNKVDDVPKKMTLNPAPIIIVEGILVFCFERIKSLIDLSVFIEAEPSVMLERRIARDNKERGYSLEEVEYQYQNHVIPAYQEHIEPFRRSADIIIPNNHGFENAVEVVTTFLNSRLK